MVYLCSVKCWISYLAFGRTVSWTWWNKETMTSINSYHESLMSLLPKKSKVLQLISNCVPNIRWGLVMNRHNWWWFMLLRFEFFNKPPMLANYHTSRVTTEFDICCFSATFSTFHNYSLVSTAAAAGSTSAGDQISIIIFSSAMDFTNQK